MFEELQGVLCIGGAQYQTQVQTYIERRGVGTLIKKKEKKKGEWGGACFC